MPMKSFGNPGRVLVGHQTGGNFGAGPGRNDGLAAFALVTAGEPVDLECRPGGTLLERSISPLAEQFWNSEELLILTLFEGQPRELFALIRGERLHVFVKTGNRDSPVFVTQLREQLGER